LAGEEAVLAVHNRALVVRTNLFGWNLQPKHSLAEWFLERFESGVQSPGFTDILFNPLHALDLARALLRLLDLDKHGLYHVGGGDCLSKYEFGVKLAVLSGYDPDLIKPTTSVQADLLAARPGKICLDCSRYAALIGDQLPGIDQSLQAFLQLRETWKHAAWERIQ
jgi:dTDP-4-dehydrorhamnose reductase